MNRKIEAALRWRTLATLVAIQQLVCVAAGAAVLHVDGFDAAGTFLGTTKLRATFQGNHEGTEGAGEFVAQQFDPAGAAQGTDSGTAVATRITVEPL